ncbi:MAG: sugar ABC transporter permease [Thermoflexales bacterium]|nr:sugar ABC transporter permease [Thermoflexales bacterium]
MSELLSQVLATLAAILLGVLGIAGLFLGLDFLVGQLPQRLQPKVRPWAYIGPALLILGFYLVYPALHTLYLSLLDAKSERFVGLQNYLWTFTSPEMRIAFRNNLLWIVLMTALSVGLGLVIAVLVDRVRYESAAKSVIFLPVAISFVGASVIWRFVYAYKPASVSQIGLLNAVAVALGGQPVGWLVDPAVNNFALIAVGVWLQTGFCMVILSAALKAIPREILEAARVDGASEWRIFWQITVPMISSTIAVVATTVVINALKAFDIVYVMTNGNYGTEVIANRMYKEMFHFRNFGRASAIAIILLLAIIPVMAANIRRFQVQEEMR